MEPVVEESPPEPSTSTGVSHGVTSRKRRTIKAKLEVIKEEPVGYGSDTPNDEIDIMVEALIHEVTFLFHLLISLIELLSSCDVCSHINWTR